MKTEKDTTHFTWTDMDFNEFTKIDFRQLAKDVGLIIVATILMVGVPWALSYALVAGLFKAFGM